MILFDKVLWNIADKRKKYKKVLLIKLSTTSILVSANIVSQITLAFLSFVIVVAPAFPFRGWFRFPWNIFFVFIFAGD